MNNRVTIIVLLCVIAVGAVLRIDNIYTRTIGHVETYVPNIVLPQGISDPEPRYSLLSTITGTIAAEPHPPAYYLIMFPWTKIFGTSVLALRFPSVLFGVLSIVLVYALCLSTEDKLTGILASGMLALNGLHIYWSQEAKFYAMACFLGLLSTVLLVKVLKNNRHQKLLRYLYGTITLTGLGTVIYFWLILAVHMIWTVVNELRDKKNNSKYITAADFNFYPGMPSLGNRCISKQKARVYRGKYFLSIESICAIWISIST